VIDFRYHLVSIVAVFLALGIGLVLGSTALQPYVVQEFKRQSNLEKAKIDQLIATNKQVQGQIDSDQGFAQAASDELLSNLLVGQRVVLVLAPGAPSQVTSGVIQTVTRAGATVSGQVQLNPAFFDGSSVTQNELDLLARKYTPPGVTLRPGTPLAQASQVLASAILTKDGPGQPVAGQTDSASTAALGGFANDDFLAVKGPVNTHATLAVVVIPATPPSTNPSNPASQKLVTVAEELGLASQGTVVAGSLAGSGPGSAIDVMRTFSRASHVSSVNNADYMTGQIVVAQALYEQLHGVVGDYGVAPASSPGPSPAPSVPEAAVPPTPSPAPSRAGRKTPGPSPSGAR
jgi:Copper transport outer membrane protein, MctB